MNKFYVYAYLNPLKPGNFNYGTFNFDYEPFYIGKGEGQRLYVHLSNSILCKEKTHKSNRIKKLIRLGFNLKNNFIIKIEQNLNETDAFALEHRLITIIGRCDLNHGPLLNLTDGGGGVSGAKFPDRTLSPEHIEKFKMACLGRKCSLEEREKIRIRALNQSQETRRKISESKKGVLKSEIVKLNMSLAKRTISDETLREIKILYSTGNYSKMEISRKLGIKSNVNYRLLRSKRYLDMIL